MENTGKALVSIIMPCHNSEKWIIETIRSVQAQTYSNWELLITDDASQDGTKELIRQMQCDDSRIKLYSFEENRGAAAARNNSLAQAEGRFIAYLDSDDLWKEKKLELQLEFMHENAIAMCYTDYDIVEEDGTYRKTIHVPKSVTYDQFLKRPITCTHSLVFDTSVVDKQLLVMPNIRRGQDGATWLCVLKNGHMGYALGVSLAQYRRHEGSLSSNKLKAIKRVWYMYRKVEELPLHYACRCFVSYAINACKKYI